MSHFRQQTTSAISSQHFTELLSLNVTQMYIIAKGGGGGGEKTNTKNEEEEKDLRCRRKKKNT